MIKWLDACYAPPRIYPSYCPCFYDDFEELCKGAEPWRALIVEQNGLELASIQVIIGT